MATYTNDQGNEIEINNDFFGSVHVAVRGDKVTERQASAQAKAAVTKLLGYDPGHYVSSGGASEKGKTSRTYVFSRTAEQKENQV